MSHKVTPRSLSFRSAIWLFPVVTTLHNAEEALWLPAWSQHAGALHPPVSATAFRFAVVVLTIGAYVVTAGAALRRERWLTVAAAYWTAMLLNVLFPHVLASIVTRGYTPGVATALFCNLPVCTYLLHRGLREGHVAARALLCTAVVFVPCLVAALPLLFRAGDLLAR